ncbi:MAG: threonine synthase [Actinobacteria bacterium HGW-Actinobacteria-7]|jgi:threonine synthase|nr:MAG: threonine synthase [Actinobacteria bacterium HGW-Actinobacteria-7]
MKTVTTYLDTRGLGHGNHTFTDVVVTGIAPGGGLFVPESLPHLTLPEILAFSAMPYWRRAAAVFTRCGVDLPSDRIDLLMRQAYGAQWSDERIAVIEEVVAGMHVLELWHGPTSAFKDMALQCMPQFFSEAISRKQEREELSDDILILVATSGDTGKAALDGFADRPHTRIVVFYPVNGVSDIQRLQMVTQQGDNVAVFGVRGNFDDCQSAVKEAFADEEFRFWLHTHAGVRLSSANSINWGRLMPQIVYYVSAYADMVASGGVVAGEPMDVCVPTGNFGNILGAYYAREMGVPIGRLICASNENNVLADFIATGVYDISDRDFVTTPSPSMDILISSNLERLLYHLAGPEAVRGWMGELAQNKRFQIDRETFKTMREFMVGDYVSNDESLATVKRVFDETGYLMDPHTAVAWEVAERTHDHNPMLVVSTAHWAKFGADVLRALYAVPYAAPLPAELDELSGVDVLAKVQEIAPTAALVPRALAELDSAKVRFASTVDSGRDGIVAVVEDWLS